MKNVIKNITKKIKSNILVTLGALILSSSALATHNSCENMKGDWSGLTRIYLPFGVMCKYETKAYVYREYDNRLVADVTIQKLGYDYRCPDYSSDHTEVLCSDHWVELTSSIIDAGGPLYRHGSKARLHGHVFSEKFGYLPMRLKLQKDNKSKS